KRKDDPKGRAFALYAFDSDSASVSLDESLRQRESEAGSDLLAAVAVVAALEAGKQPRGFLGRHAYAGIGHGGPHHVGNDRRRKLRRAARLRVLNCVRE